MAVGLSKLSPGKASTAAYRCGSKGSARVEFASRISSPAKTRCQAVDSPMQRATNRRNLLIVGVAIKTRLDHFQLCYLEVVQSGLYGDTHYEQVPPVGRSLHGRVHRLATSFGRRTDPRGKLHPGAPFGTAPVRRRRCLSRAELREPDGHGESAR